MKKRYKHLGIIALGVFIGLVMSGCGSLFGIFSGAVTIRSVNNLSSVRLGGTLQFRATGRDIVWSVSSTSDGIGPVANGTDISSSGVLTVSPGETSIYLYVIAVSARNDKSAYKQIRVVTVSGVTVSSSSQSVVCGRTLQLRASVTGNNNPDNVVTWKVSSNAAGTGAVSSGTYISASGLLTAAIHETVPMLYVTATSVVDPSKSGSVAISVIVPIVTGVTVSPSNQSIIRGRSFQFSASVTGINDPVSTVTWRVSSNAAGTGAVTAGTGISANGSLTVSPNESLTTLYVIATSVADPSKSGSVAVFVLVPVVTSVTVRPSNQSVSKGGTIQFYATVTGTNDPGTAVTWKVSSNAAGNVAVSSGTNINANGLLAVAVNETAAVLYIFATSVADPTKFGSVPVTLTAPVTPTVVSVAVSPSNQSVERGRTVQFSAAVTGNNNPANTVTWRVSTNASGTGAVTPGTNINANGLLTVSANETSTTLYVIAASTVDPSKFGSVVVSVIIPASPVTPVTPTVPPVVPVLPPTTPVNPIAPAPTPVFPEPPAVISVTIGPSNPSVQRGSPLQLSASVSGTSNQRVTWRVSTTSDGTGGVANGTTINPNGRLTVSANETASVLYVIATSAEDPSKSGFIAVTVIQGSPGQGNR